jgi:hypothetical protein
VENQLVEARKETPAEDDLMTETGWQGYYSRQRRAIKLIRYKPASPGAANKEKRIEQLSQCKNYLEDVDRLLVSRRAKTWSEIKASQNDVATSSFGRRRFFPTPTTPPFERLKYYTFTTRTSSNLAPKTMDGLYHELYEACFSGDDDKIRRLCLPPAGAKSKTPALQISVRAAGQDGAWQHNTGEYFSRYLTSSY